LRGTFGDTAPACCERLVSSEAEHPMTENGLR